MKSHLKRLVEIHFERVAAAVRVEAAAVLSHRRGSGGLLRAAAAAGAPAGAAAALVETAAARAALELDPGRVVGASVGRSVEAEADDEDAAVGAELDGVAAAAVAPLVAPGNVDRIAFI